jgi:hypothetical protein
VLHQRLPHLQEQGPSQQQGPAGLHLLPPGPLVSPQHEHPLRHQVINVTPDVPC